MKCDAMIARTSRGASRGAQLCLYRNDDGNYIVIIIVAAAVVMVHAHYTVFNQLKCIICNNAMSYNEQCIHHTVCMCTMSMSYEYM